MDLRRRSGAGLPARGAGPEEVGTLAARPVDVPGARVLLPFDRVAATAPVLVADKRELLLRVRDLEARALSTRTTLAVACLQDARFVTPWTRDVYRTLAARGAQVVMCARGLPAHVAEGVRGVDLDEDDPLGDQWTVLFEGEDPVCLAAHDLHGAHADEERTFEYAVTDDPELVHAVADALGLPVRPRSPEGP